MGGYRNNMKKYVDYNNKTIIQLSLYCFDLKIKQNIYLNMQLESKFYVTTSEISVVSDLLHTKLRNFTLKQYH